MVIGGGGGADVSASGDCTSEELKLESGGLCLCVFYLYKIDFNYILLS